MSTQSRLEAALAAHYEVRKEIGAGGMATVFLARDLKHDRDVAIKVLHPDLGAALGAERFLSEIKTTAKLQHPHILPLIDSGEADTLLYYVMPFVVGESLRQRMDREGQLPINEAIRIAREVAGALDYAHRNGVVHRDIKPENILLNDGQALVADFGIALAVSAAGGARMTQTGLSLGTPQYMSPEQAMGERAIDARSDIYALGAVTYEMLTGEPPFTGPNVQAIVSKIMSQRPTPVSAVRDTVPPTTEEAVMTALCKLPADRFATAAQFAAALTSGSGNFTSSAASARVGPGRRKLDIIAKRIGLPAIPIAILALAFASWAVGKSGETSLPVRRYAITLDSGEKALRRPAIAISPDGSMFVHTGGPGGAIFLHRRNEFTSRELQGTAGAINPVFSQDGKKLAFTTRAFELKTVDLASGAITVVSDSAWRSPVAWGVDGFIYTGFRRGIGPLFRVRAQAGAVPEQATFVAGTADDEYHASPAPLPGGKGIVFSVVSRRAGEWNISIAAAEMGNRPYRILFEGANPVYLASGHLLYQTRNGSTMAIRFDPKKMEIAGDPVIVSERQDEFGFEPWMTAVAADGTLMFTRRVRTDEELVWVSRSGQRQRLDSTWRGSFAYPAISPGGDRVAVSFSDGTSGDAIWIKQLDDGTAHKLVSEMSSSYPAWTPDGKMVSFYGSATKGPLRLWTRSADGRDSAEELAIQGEPVESAWPPGGDWVIYRTSVSGSGKGDIFAVQPRTRMAPIKIAASSASETQPAISPNGRWIAYASSETGRFEIYVVPFPNPSNLKWAVSTNGGTEPAWARNGRELFYRNGASKMVAVGTGTESSVFTTGVTRELFATNEYLALTGHRNFDVGRDGRFLMVWDKGSFGDGQIYFVDNWFQELKAKFK